MDEIDVAEKWVDHGTPRLAAPGPEKRINGCLASQPDEDWPPID